MYRINTPPIPPPDVLLPQLNSHFPSLQNLSVGTCMKRRHEVLFCQDMFFVTVHVGVNHSRKLEKGMEEDILMGFCVVE